MEFNELTYACALNRIFINNTRLSKSIAEYFPYPSELFNASEETLRGIFHSNERYISAIKEKKILEECSREVSWCKSNNIKILYYNDPDYPRRLKECPDAPALLFVKGEIPSESERMVAIVGTRKPTTYGIKSCREIIRDLSKLHPKPVIVSGLAYGIDICAHESALEYGCNTIAVMGTPVEHIYPSSHSKKAEQISRSGALISEYNKGFQTHPHHFLQRNRIIAGLCDAIILIESNLKGGGMVTASIANSYSRDVFALPGRICDATSEGCNVLIENNIAKLITSAQTISKEMGWETPQPKMGKKSKFHNLLEQYGGIKRNILLTLSVDLEIDLPALIERCNDEPSKILAALTELEMEQIVEIDIYGHYHINL